MKPIPLPHDYPEMLEDFATRDDRLRRHARIPRDREPIITRKVAIAVLVVLALIVVGYRYARAADGCTKGAPGTPLVKFCIKTVARV
jgi:hypothetical protein